MPDISTSELQDCIDLLYRIRNSGEAVEFEDEIEDTIIALESYLDEA